MVLTVYDLLGRELVRLFDGVQDAGLHQVLWGGKDSKGNRVSSGIYLYKLQVGGNEETRSMILLR